jgi:thiamine-monophosphate kinase
MSYGEFSLIARYFSAFGRGDGVDLGVGDDAALLTVPPGESLVVSVDTMLAGRHFPEDAFPEDIGFRAVAVAASDLAAMGATPLGMTLSLTLPEADEVWLHPFSEGIGQAARDFALPLVGGDTTRGPLSIAVQVMGSVPQGGALLRSGARAGDLVYVSGTLGDAAAGLALLQAQWLPPEAHREFLVERYFRPRPRLSLGLSLRGIATAAIDVSDGLLQDLGHIANASGCGMRIDAQRLPLSAALRTQPDRGQQLAWALAGGDDYELCVTAAQDARLPEAFTCIGEVVAGDGVFCAGAPEGLSPGYTHF